MTVKSFMKSLSASMAAFAILGGAILTVSILNASPAFAQSGSKAVVDRAIAQGLVGETASGYLELVSGSASPAVVNAMREINIGRKSVYTRLARQQNVAVEVVAALTGEKQIAKAPIGSKIMRQNGQWVTK